MTEGPREHWIGGARKWPGIVKFSQGRLLEIVMAVMITIRRDRSEIMLIFPVLRQQGL